MRWPSVLARPSHFGVTSVGALAVLIGHLLSRWWLGQLAADDPSESLNRLSTILLGQHLPEILES
jgi:hypothetical protein